MQQIAEQIGVSRTSVSAVLNDRPIRMGDETRRRILELAATCDYRPNFAARMLHGKPGRIIGMVRFGYALNLFSELSEVITKALNQAGYSLYYANVHDDGEAKRAMRELVGKGAEGFIMFRHCSGLEHEECPKPMVLVGDHADTYDLAVDLSRGGELAGMHFYEQAARRWAFLSPGRGGASEIKFKGFCQAARTYGVQEPLFVDFTKYHDDAEVYNELKHRAIDAVLCSNDFVAASFLSARGELRVPDDLLLCGFDGMSFCMYTSPRLTTVIQPVQILAQRATALLFDKLERNDTKRMTHPELIEPVLYCAESTRCRCEVRNRLIRPAYTPLLELEHKELHR